jgi:hypothetical protein
MMKPLMSMRIRSQSRQNRDGSVGDVKKKCETVSVRLPEAVCDTLRLTQRLNCPTSATEADMGRHRKLTALISRADGYSNFETAPVQLLHALP